MKLNSISRRQLMKSALAGAGAYYLPQTTWGLDTEPHQFLFICMQGGADPSYLFDARPLEMTKNNLLQNYSGKEPSVWKGNNGQQCLASAATAPLAAYKNDLCIVNGVFMDNQFVGHSQVMNILFTGNPFGGNSFLPFLNSALLPTPLDGLRLGNIFAEINNHGAIIPAGTSAMGELTQKLQGAHPLHAQDPSMGFIMERLKVNAQGQGSFSKGSQRMLDGMGLSTQLAPQLAQMPPYSPTSVDLDETFINQFTSFSQQKSLRCGLINLEIANAAGSFFNFDTHDLDSAAAQPELFGGVAKRVAKIIELLKNTAYDSQHSMFDITTVMVTSEFARTMRQEMATFSETGTDHNTLTNSFIFFGKNIKGGTVIGQSDYQSSSETLSPSHLQLDSKKLSIMARPFDFASEKPLMVLPTEFKREHYLTSGSIVNTILDIFNIDKKYYRNSGGTSSPLLPSLKSMIK